jgi:sugar O-acyltransferase (sialic acid O-acetyltransferase NeuD family)
MKSLVIFGASAFAEMAHYYFTRDSSYSVVAFTVDAAYLKEATFQGLPIIAFEEIEKNFPPGETAMFIAMGIQRVNRQRAAKVVEAEARGYRLASFLSSKAKVADNLELKPNTFIMEEVCMLPGVSIGKDTILWPRCGLGFHCRIGDHCWLVAATLGESVIVGDYTFIGLNATVGSYRTIAASNIIGAGAVILEDTEEFSVYKAQASKASRVPSYRLRHI